MIATPKNALFLIAKAYHMIGHGKVHATYQTLIKTVYEITGEDIQWNVESFPSYQFNKYKSALQTIVSSRVLERVQLDLMDFQSKLRGIIHGIYT